MSVHEQHAPTRLNDEGAGFIGRFEGFRGHLYNDAAGHCTIGYGHLVHLGNCNGSEPAAFKQDISESGGRGRLRRRRADRGGRGVLLRACPAQSAAVRRAGELRLQPGRRRVRELDPAQGHQRAQPRGRPRPAQEWVHAGGQVLPGFVTRRKAEAQLFTAGHYTDAGGNGAVAPTTLAGVGDRGRQRAGRRRGSDGGRPVAAGGWPGRRQRREGRASSAQSPCSMPCSSRSWSCRYGATSRTPARRRRPRPPVPARCSGTRRRSRSMSASVSR